jgi:hypothetical protein
MVFVRRSIPYLGAALAFLVLHTNLSLSCLRGKVLTATSMKMAVLWDALQCSSTETSVDIYHTTLCYIPDDRFILTVCNIRCLLHMVQISNAVVMPLICLSTHTLKMYTATKTKLHRVVIAMASSNTRRHGAMNLQA